ncbi:MAG: hypothetical protein ACKVOP_06365 [Sphingomonadaceae bacterium]
MLLTDLPLVWGEGTPADVLAGRVARAPMLAAIEARIDVTPIDALDAARLGRGVAIIAQPRRLAPDELVAFDRWVRGGGRAMIFADPELRWPSAYASGDVRRAPPVTLLDPLLTHWGLTLGDSDGREGVRTLGARRVAMLAAGRWRGPSACGVLADEVIDCAIGKGRVILVGDADMLDDRLAAVMMADNAEWVIDTVFALSGSERAESRSIDFALLAAALAGAALFTFAIYRRTRT